MRLKKNLVLLTVPLTVCLAGELRADSVVVFNEIMYHPATNEPAMEWIELRNQLAVDVDMSDWSLAGGIQYTFPSNSIIRGGGFVVVAISPATLRAATGLPNIFGPFTNRLGNGGDRLELRNNSRRLMDEVNYGADGDWPVAPDGSGVSLARLDRDSASRPAENWTWSEQLGGTPGADNFPFIGGTPPGMRLIAIDSSWNYDTTGTDLGMAWSGPAYNDTSWSSRVAFTNRSIPTVFSTGVGASGVAQAAGTLDPHYILTAAAQGTVGTNATVMTPNGAWLANDTTSAWIGVVNSGAVNVNAGSYNFRTTFSLAGFLPSSAQLNLLVAADNDVTNVFLNGAATGISFSGFSGFSSPFTLNSGFVNGTNSLEFRTFNQPPGGSPNPAGFRGVASGAALALNTNTPLPAGLTTYYFRKAFVFVGDPASTQLKLNPVAADGAVIYLNSVEVYRQNMPAGSIGFSTPASSDLASPAYSGLMPIPSASLVAGTNVLAVELHQAVGSTDGPLFGAELISTLQPALSGTLAFNELSSSTNAEFWLELVNYGTNSVQLDGYVIYRDGPTNGEFVFPSGQSLGPGGYLALTNTTLGFHPVSGDKLFLLSSARDKVMDAVVVKKTPRAREPAGTGRWFFPDQPTPGAANSFAFHNEIVINEIMYHHARVPTTNDTLTMDSPEAWIEFFNNSGNSVDLTGWELDGGIQYRFSPGKTIPSGGYLVVADDAASLRALYPAVDIVGNFGGRLARGSDLIVLKDPAGNPADQVRYYTWGRWPEYADGGGSSLELRDPNADNSKAEAWAASDETGRTSWQNYAYRMVANIPPSSGQPTMWNDFIFGLLDRGECLIDDLSVVESPTNNPIQLVANGNLENGLTGWRVLGTHNRSRVEVDPDNPGNHVLHLIATGYQEHMHNHIETTYTNGRTVANGREYQISFRARWLAGNNLLNTRLYFDRVARTTTLPVPTRSGTPGAQNSRHETNIGPTCNRFQHRPVIPQAGEAVTVTVVAQDPQGVGSCEVWWSANSGAWNTGAMAAQGDGLYLGTIPGYPAGSIVQFYVRAFDGLGVASTCPARGTNSGALYTVNDGQANLPLAHNLRIILTTPNVDLLHGTAQGVNQTNVMSNDLLPCTVVYDERRAYYDCGVHLRGSQRGRYSDIRTGFHIEFPTDDLFRGVHPVMLIDRSGAGDATANRQEEIVIKHIMNRAGGIPGTYPEICRLIAPRRAHTGPAQFFPRHEDLFIEEAFEHGGDGTLFEMELIYYPTSANAAGYKNPQPDSVIGTDVTNLGDDKEIYRYNFLIKNHRDTDDYNRFIALGKAWSLTGSALDAQTRQLMDIDQWMRAYALVSLCSVGDMYTFGNNHNFFIYARPADGKVLYFPWDMDFAFSRGASGQLVGDQNLAKIVNLLPNQRCLYAHMLDIIGVSFNTNYMAYWTDHYDNFAPGQSYAGSLSTIAARVPFVRNAINSAGGNAAFNVSGPSLITTATNLVTLTGTAPVQIKTITVNGKEYRITWTSLSGWRLTVAVNEPTNVLNFVAYDLYGNTLTNFSRTVTVNYTGPSPDPVGAVVFNEIMYNAAGSDAAYIELFNTSSNFSFDLSDWRVDGLGYTFPKGSLITNRQFLILANSMISYAAAYGSSLPAPFDQFPGNLRNDGETLTLLAPGPNPGEEIVIDRVRYESVPPWPTGPKGLGPSLQLIDPAQDNRRVGNWSEGGGWRYVTFTNMVASNGINFFVFLSSASDVYVDDIKLVADTVPEAGPNLLANGDFESALSGPWAAGGNHTNSVISTSVSHSGQASLHVIATGAGSANPAASIRQIIPGSTSNYTATLSYWYLPSTNANVLTMRTAPGSSMIFNNGVRITLSTPGTANSVAAALPPFPPLWLNEVQPENITSIADSQGEREPWIELYNAGTNAVSLEGYYLANNYTNLTPWTFPPGSDIQPGEFKVIFADGQPDQSTNREWHTSFRLSPGSGSVALVWTPGLTPQILDYLNYTNIAAGRSYGDFLDGQPFTRQEFFRATPGATNDNASAPLIVFINEWMAANTHTLPNTNNADLYDDWFELYNPGATPANLGGFFLTDNFSNQFQFAIPAGFVIPPQSFLLVWADNKPGLNNTNLPELHVNFRLNQAGEQIGLFAGDGTPIDAVNFEAQFNDISQGRYPDGPGAIYFLATPTPGAPNSIWANRYPVLAPVPDARILSGQTFSFTATAADPDSPPQTLTFTLDAGTPPGAAIDATSGVFGWTPTLAQAPGTNLITVRVTDNGTPPLSAVRSFNVVVTTELRVTGLNRPLNGNIELTFGTIPGKTYRVEYKDDLNATVWTPLTPDTVAGSSSMTIPDNIRANAHRFYRIVQSN